MQHVDVAIAQFVNSFYGRFPLFDKFVLEIANVNSFKLMPIMALLCCVWFKDGPNNRQRHIIINGLVGGFAALVVTRVMQNVGPEHLRPALAGILEHPVRSAAMDPDWSSFPSDTSALALALAFAIFQAARGPGLLALFWALAFATFPRLYGGYHYASDLVVGGAIGIACVWGFANSGPLARWAHSIVDNLELQKKPLFYALFFITNFQVGTYFTDVRKLGEKTFKNIGVVRTAHAKVDQEIPLRKSGY